MFCPNCGKSDQTENTYCRNCGKFLPDFDNLKKREVSPEEHLKANSVLNIMTAIVSLTLAILLYVNFLGEENTPVLIYVTAGFLTAIFAWQVQIFIRSLMLKKQIILPNRNETEAELKSATNDLLNEADFSDDIPANDFGNETRKFETNVRRQNKTM